MVIGTLERDIGVSAPRRSIRVPRSSTLVGLAAIAALASVAAVLAVGVTLANAAQNELLGARAAIHQTIVDGFVEEGLPPTSDSSVDALDRTVDLHLLGGETMRVKVLDRSGVVASSDADGVIGQSLEIGDSVTRALAGTTVVQVDDPEALGNVTERSLGGLIEHHLPIAVDGRVVGAFEIYEESSSFTASLEELEGHVWTAVGIGVGAIAIAVAAVAAGWIVASDRKRRLAEALLGEVLTAGDDERRRILGALHDDIGQPLYRVLHGLEGSSARIPDPDVRAELAILEGLVRGIDGALRTELRILHAGLVEGDDLRAAIDRLADATRRESLLEVHVSGDIEGTPVSSAAATALFRAAQEAVINARKHAAATRITIDLRSDRRGAMVVVEDDGKGWNETAGMGITTTRQRLAAIGGSLRIRHCSPSGTRVMAAVPALPAAVER